MARSYCNKPLVQKNQTPAMNKSKFIKKEGADVASFTPVIGYDNVNKTLRIKGTRPNAESKVCKPPKLDLNQSQKQLIAMKEISPAVQYSPCHSGQERHFLRKEISSLDTASIDVQFADDVDTESTECMMSHISEPPVAMSEVLLREPRDKKKFNELSKKLDLMTRNDETSLKELDLREDEACFIDEEEEETCLKKCKIWQNEHFSCDRHHYHELMNTSITRDVDRDLTAVKGLDENHNDIPRNQNLNYSGTSKKRSADKSFHNMSERQSNARSPEDLPPPYTHASTAAMATTCCHRCHQDAPSYITNHGGTVNVYNYATCHCGCTNRQGARANSSTSQSSSMSHEMHFTVPANNLNKSRHGYQPPNEIEHSGARRGHQKHTGHKKSETCLSILNRSVKLGIASCHRIMLLTNISVSLASLGHLMATTSMLHLTSSPLNIHSYHRY